MRTLYESLLDINGVETSVEPIIMIDNWCKDNISGNYTIDEKTLVINPLSSIEITNNKLVEFPSYIRFGTVNGSFSCSDCTSLKSLKGAPIEVSRDFYCNNCSSLKSLEGAPKKVDGDFYCNNCASLTSLENIPTRIKGKIYSHLK